jgi:hypothetical protein
LRYSLKISEDLGSRLKGCPNREFHSSGNYLLVPVVDPEVVDDVELRLVEDVEAVDDTLVLEEREVSLYNSNLFPAPQYSILLPGQTKLQSPREVRAEPAPRELPQ